MRISILNISFYRKKKILVMWSTSALLITSVVRLRLFQRFCDFYPKKYDLFIDAFGGGFNVGINISADKVIYNDLNYLVTNLIRSFREYDTYDYLLYIKRIIKKIWLRKSQWVGIFGGKKLL